MREKYPKILVVSNNCFSLSNSNGRTLGGFFYGWPKECLAQFCLGLTDPNFDLCDNFFCVSDVDALNAFIFNKRSKYKHADVTDSLEKINNSKDVQLKHRRTAFTMFLRNIIWDSNRWRNGFDEWVDNFNPDIILFQSGDATFMSRIALDIAKKRSLPLVIFNTEPYFFFNKSWFDHHFTDSFIFPIYNYLYRKQYNKMMAYASYTIYCNSQLKEDYDKFFDPNKSSVMYTSSNISFEPKEFDTDSPIFSYLGNLGLNRPLALIEIADVLGRINKSYKLDVYGKLPADQQSIFDGCRNIYYHGCVSYDKVTRIIKESDVLFHTEYNKGEWINQLKYAFSTKIADSIASGSNFLLYAPENLACSKYVIDNQSAWYVEKKEALYDTLKKLINNKDMRDSILTNAKVCAEANFNGEKNHDIFRNLILDIVNNKL